MKQFFVLCVLLNKVQESNQMMDSDGENTLDQISQRYDDTLKHRLYSLYHGKLENIGEKYSEKLQKNYKNYEMKLSKYFQKLKDKSEHFGREWLPTEIELLRMRKEEMDSIDHEYNRKASLMEAEISNMRTVLNEEFMGMSILYEHYKDESINLFNDKILDKRLQAESLLRKHDFIQEYLQEKLELFKPYENDIEYVLQKNEKAEKDMWDKYLQNFKDNEEKYKTMREEIIKKFNKKLQELLDNDQNYKRELRKNLDTKNRELCDKFHKQEQVILKEMNHELDEIAKKYLKHEKKLNEKNDPSIGVRPKYIEQISSKLGLMARDIADLLPRIPDPKLADDLYSKLEEFKSQNPRHSGVDFNIGLNSLFSQMLLNLKKSNPILENPQTKLLHFECTKISRIDTIIENCRQYLIAFQLLTFEQRERVLSL